MSANRLTYEELKKHLAEHKRAQEEIEGLSKFPSENPSPVLRVQRDGTILYGNEASLPLLAKFETGIGGKVPVNWHHLIQKVFESEKTGQQEEEVDGRVFSFVIAPILDEDYVNLYARDITECVKAQEALREERDRAQQYLDIAGTLIVAINCEGEVTLINRRGCEVLGYDQTEIEGKKWFDNFIPQRIRDEMKSVSQKILKGEIEVVEYYENAVVTKEGEERTIAWHNTVLRDDEGNIIGHLSSGEDITERSQRENELRGLNQDLVLASRRAGMAEVATDILHNVGNVLNSINVSARFIEEKVLNSKAANLKKVIDVLAEHTDDLGTFLTEDERGQHVPIYLTEATRLILDEQAFIEEKVKTLTKNVEHVKQVIKAQQSYAKTGGSEAFTSIREVIEHAVEINHVALERSGIDLQFELAALPRIRIDKQRVLQILVNLITNAKHALSESKKKDKVLTVRCYKHREDTLRIEVTDNGIGISRENMTKIFQHGFTTKAKGHGFGLHGSALAAREMSGSLTVHSDGSGNGATFTLELPFIKSEPGTNGYNQ
jgi:PAS domain S-box-containing protein